IRSRARKKIFMGSLGQAVADDLVDFDDAREVIALALVDTVNFPDHPTADRNQAGAQFRRQLVLRELQILQENPPELSQIEDRLDPLSRADPAFSSRFEQLENLVEGLAFSLAHQ